MADQKSPDIIRVWGILRGWLGCDKFPAYQLRMPRTWFDFNVFLHPHSHSSFEPFKFCLVPQIIIQLVHDACSSVEKTFFRY